MGALARGGAAPHNPGGNLRKLSRPPAVRARPAGPVLCGLQCWSGGSAGFPARVPGQGVLQLSTPALLVGVRVLELAEGDSGVASGVVELSGPPAAGAVLQLQRASAFGYSSSTLSKPVMCSSRATM